MPSSPRPSIHDTNFSRSLFIVIWETAAKSLMDTVRQFGKPLFVLTGGDPLKRNDTVKLVRYGTSIGLRMAMTRQAYHS